MNEPGRDYDAIVVGGGFFGCKLAVMLAELFPRVLVLERESALLQRSSYANQARIHGGYHYPRSILTAVRSQANFARFVSEYSECVDSSFEHFYGIPKRFSNVTAAQYLRFCQEIGAQCKPAPAGVAKLFSRELVEAVFQVEEYAFDAVRLREHVAREMRESGVELGMKTEVHSVKQVQDEIEIATRSGDQERSLRARWVFNCTYARINHLLHRSGLPLIPLRHEYTEMALVEPPAELRRRAVTMMCGPFFSTMPFPPRGLHTLSHVRYTPHYDWEERPDGGAPMLLGRDAPVRPTRQLHMIRDAQRYLPCLGEAMYVDSIWEVKTILPQCEINDGRPILFKRHHELPGLVTVMGGKIDNIYDLPKELRTLFPQVARKAS